MIQEDFEAGSRVGQDLPPGQSPPPPGEESIGAELRGYLNGLGLSIVLTAASFWAVGTDLIYGPGIIMAIAVLAVAQMGVHLVFFLHLSTAPDNLNTVVALAFGILIAGLIIFGSVWVMYHLDHNQIPMEELLRMQP
jgi:cytochrome o ubiquinol oxidase operon protein cyoD